jgi:hypothetical protein
MSEINTTTSGSEQLSGVTANGGGDSLADNAGASVRALCYLRGTRILTPAGPAAIETLAIGDPVVTRFAGIQPIRWIGRQSFLAIDARTNQSIAPVRIGAGALGHLTPARDLLVSPPHAMLIDGQLIAARHLVNGRTITQPVPAVGAAPGRIDYFQLELARHDCVLAEGAWSETFPDSAELRAGFDNAAEFSLLYPGHHPVAPTLCAPRPPRGPQREAALRPLVERAGTGVTPGPLEGFLDQIVDGARVEGWAWDKSHPDLPVLLEIRLAEHPLGSVLACERRADLVQARKGRGHCSFSFISPIPLGPEAWSTLTVHRAADGILLPPSDTYRAALAALSPNHKPALRLVA